jgi:hypothetical protein
MYRVIAAVDQTMPQSTKDITAKIINTTMKSSNIFAYRHLQDWNFIN